MNDNNMAMETVQVRPIETPCFSAMPPAPRHAISTHLPGWDLMLEFVKKDPAFFAKFKDMYPRFILHRDVKQLIGTILTYTKADGQFCMPLPSLASAKACIAFVTATKRTDGLDSVPSAEISIRAFELIGIRIYGVFFPISRMPLVMPFWVNAGVGVSSRLAEEALKNPDSIREIDIAEALPETEEAESSKGLRERIASLMERAPVGPPREPKVAAGDVYLYQTGMAAIYYVHEYLLKWRSNQGSKTVVLSIPFHKTTHIFEYWGAGLQFYPLGTELDELEQFLKAEASAGRPVQAVWTEFPSNPLLVSADLTRLRHMADSYNFALVIDDTVGSFCNIDVLPVADIVVTSLTKSFSGYADVMGGSAVLNPSSPLYRALNPLFKALYADDVFPADAAQLLHNSIDYLQRSTVLNRNAAALVRYLHPLTQDPDGVVKAIFYPPVSPTLANYMQFQRPSTADFTPGYGCLFSVELSTIEAAIAFYDNLHVHHGPHLGAHRTLALPYVRALYDGEFEKVGRWGIRPTQVRISVGLEGERELIEVFKFAVGKAEEARAKGEKAEKW